MIDYKEIRKQIAMENSVLIADDDPILVSVTLNELIFQRYVDIVEEKNQAHRKAIEAAQQKGIADAKVTAGSVITQAADYVSEQAHMAVIAAMQEAVRELEEFKVQAVNTNGSDRNLLIAGLYLAAAVCFMVTMGMMLKVWVFSA